MATTSLVVAESTAANSEQQHSVYQESLPYYWFRALHYILRIPFRELIGNVARPYDPTTPLPLQDVPISATIIDTRTQIAFANPYTGRHNSNNNNNDNTNLAISISTTRSRHYLQQIRKAWRDRTSSMSWAFATAFFTSAICTVLVVVALMLNWGVPSIYLKIFLIAFVVRKWIATTLLVDRALYRLPLNLTEPDPDIDDERQNFAAI
ncbi:hypothetical protein FBU30_004558 [Linnemannia zychae]|nr:hypothetical protein FBU30_004558 [Linnemannia zychae]